MNKQQKIIVAIIAVIIVGGGAYYLSKSSGKVAVKQIDTSKKVVENTGPLNTGEVSPISGLACENWNKRPVAAMQPADVSARPAAGFSEADMVFEMPVFTNSNTRLMGVYLCNIPKEIGSLRSARHDYLPLAKSLDAVFVHWGYSKFAESLLDKKILDNIDCLTTSYCARWPQTGIMKLEDTGHITKEQIEKAITTYGYSTENKFAGYPHQEEAPMDQRSVEGNLRVAYPTVYDVAYTYDRDTNSYFRIWNNVQDTDKNNGNKIAPKNVVVMIAKSEQIKLSSDFKARGVQDPWELVPEEERAGLDYGGVGRYNNLEIGDPWFDTTDTGTAYIFLNGKKIQGTWKKDKSKLDSKLFFFDDQGQEVRFVPGQIWVEVVEPGQVVQWNAEKMNI
jgi:hypothetical protein